MELRTLRYFVAVAEELHFGRAALRVNIAQPPLSQQIRKLEQQLGVQLLTRSNRQVRLTEPGRFFLQAAKSILRQADAALAGVRAVGDAVVGEVAIGLINAVTFRGDVFSVVREFRRRYPGVAVTLKIMTSVEQVRAIRDDVIHVGFVRLPLNERALDVQPFLAEDLLVAVPRGHRLAAVRAITLSDLADEPFVMLPRGAGFGLSEQVMNLCKDAGFAPLIAQEASELQTISGLVAAGFGVSLIPSSACMLPRKEVVYRPLDPPQKVEIATVYMAEKLMPAGRAFLGVLRAHQDPAMRDHSSERRSQTDQTRRPRRGRHRGSRA
jgi:DNA-binding transcriptional LysR family regulator